MPARSKDAELPFLHVRQRQQGHLIRIKSRGIPAFFMLCLRNLLKHRRWRKGKKGRLHAKKRVRGACLSRIFVFLKKCVKRGLTKPGWFAIIAFVDDASSSVGELCNGSTYDSDSYCLGSNPSSPAISLHGQAVKTSPSQGEIRGSIPLGGAKEPR